MTKMIKLPPARPGRTPVYNFHTLKPARITGDKINLRDCIVIDGDRQKRYRAYNAARAYARKHGWEIRTSTISGGENGRLIVYRLP